MTELRGMPRAPGQRIAVRLIHDATQPGTALTEALCFGMQDTQGKVHPGYPQPGGMLSFDAILDIRDSKTGGPVFTGAFAHGPPAARFLYLSWKYVAPREHPWGWRIKIPLAGIGWPSIQSAGRPGVCLAANVAGRRPHASEPVIWRVEVLSGP